MTQTTKARAAERCKCYCGCRVCRDDNSVSGLCGICRQGSHYTKPPDCCAAMRAGENVRAVYGTPYAFESKVGHSSDCRTKLVSRTVRCPHGTPYRENGLGLIANCGACVREQAAQRCQHGVRFPHECKECLYG